MTTSTLFFPAETRPAILRTAPLRPLLALRALHIGDAEQSACASCDRPLPSLSACRPMTVCWQENLGVPVFIVFVVCPICAPTPATPPRVMLKLGAAFGSN